MSFNTAISDFSLLSSSRYFSICSSINVICSSSKILSLYESILSKPFLLSIFSKFLYSFANSFSSVSNCFFVSAIFPFNRLFVLSHSAVKSSISCFSVSISSISFSRFSSIFFASSELLYDKLLPNVSICAKIPPT